LAKWSRPIQPAIENHAIIGNLRTVALVATDGTIDFYCTPRFDSPSIFAALLDRNRGGCFRIEPQLHGVHHRQLYLPDTNVLLTRFLADEGVAEISDFMPIAAPSEAEAPEVIVRRVMSVRGELNFRMLCAPRFDYARRSHRVTLTSDCKGALFSPEGGGYAYRLRTHVPLSIRNGDVVAHFKLQPGEAESFVFERARTDCELASAAHDYVSSSFKETVNFWRRWVGKARYKGRWREMMLRSALTLKLLTSAEFGAVLAAPTFGLPEQIGGSRNWDYRYTWIRDSSFSLYALIRLGYTEEAGAFMRWLEARCAESTSDGAIQVVYGLDGRHLLPEETVGSLCGYLDCVPVRIGNDAYRQLQLDIYGELLDSVYLYNKYGEPISHDLWTHLVRMIDWVCVHYQTPDEGIWEVRGGARQFLYSRLMCWVALDRAIRLAQKRSFPAPLERWLPTRDRIYRQIFEEFWNPERQAFVQYLGGTALDASSLLMPLVKFVGPTDPRWLSTLGAIERELVSDSLVRRYEIGRAADDGFLGREGTFNMCSFWYVECLSRAGELERARLYLDKMLGYANHVGLYSEELGPRGEHLGNFPQAFTHLGLISAAYNIDLRLSAAGK
jgi:GH15 family glucan-1,4-alpha-glucosidase